MLYELLSQVFGGHVITNEWWGHTNSGQALAQPARPGFFFFFFLVQQFLVGDVNIYPGLHLYQEEISGWWLLNT